MVYAFARIAACTVPGGSEEWRRVPSGDTMGLLTRGHTLRQRYSKRNVYTLSSCGALDRFTGVIISLSSGTGPPSKYVIALS